MGLPGVRVEVSGHAAFNADPVSPASMAKRPAQIVLPAAKDALHQAFGRIIERMTPRCMSCNPLLIDGGDTLHFKTSAKLSYFFSQPKSVKVIY